MLRNTTRQFCSTSILSSELKLADIKKSQNDVQVVVIGAGLAGLSATSHLIKHGFNNTIILEATNRFGGRVNSTHFGDTFCELGAKWITMDASVDSTYELIRHVPGLEKKILEKNEKMYIYSKGEQVNQRFPELVDLLFKKLCSGIELERKYKGGVLHDLNNVHTYLHTETTKIIKSLFQTEQSVANDIFLNLMKEFSSLMGCCLEYVNIEHITKLRTNLTSPIYVPTGMDNILCHITSTFDMRHVKIGKPVGFIKWFDSSNVKKKTVCCIDGSTFAADHIICTLPLGVLKNFSKFMFNPMLPKEKLNSIKNLGFGCPLKIYFEYEKNIRPWFSVSIRPVGSFQKRCEEMKWTHQIMEISKVPTSRRVLEIVIGGYFYEEIEKLPDKEIQNKVTELLRKCLKNTSIPYPISILRSNWSSNACFLGGKPYLSTASTLTDIKTLAAPLGDMSSLLFAGDATILNGFGSVDGARRSGIREAMRIIEYYKKQS